MSRHTNQVDYSTPSPTLWEDGAWSLWKLSLCVFFFALSARVIVALVFFLRWGFHTVSQIELWFYYGVAKGAFELYSPWDPTWWILRGLGGLFGGEALLYSVHWAAGAVASVNAALFAVLVAELHDRRTGLLAGLIFCSMVMPMFNSAAGMTHDIFAYTPLLLSLIGAVKLFKNTGWRRLLFAGMCIFFLFIGAHVGPGVLVMAGACAIYILWQGIRAAVPAMRDRDGAFAVYCVITIGAAVLIYYLALPSLKEWLFDMALETRGIDVRAQIRAGSKDLLPTSPGDYWLRFNFLLFFLPAGLYVAFKKRDALCWGLLLAGFLASCATDRGTRFLAFGVALAGALAFANWRVLYRWILAACLGFVTGYFGRKYSLEYVVAFPSVALLLYGFIQWTPPGERVRGDRLVLWLGLLWLVAGLVLAGLLKSARLEGMGGVLVCMLVPPVIVLVDAWRGRSEGSRMCVFGIAAVLYLFAVIIPSVNMLPKNSNEEYRLYRWLGEHVTAGERIFVPWGYGYMAEAISGLTAEASPSNIEFDLHKIYWMSEEEAARTLRDRNVRYIVVSTDYFELLGHSEKTGDFRYRSTGATMYHPAQMGITNIEKLKETALFRLLYEPDGVREFRLLRSERDRTGEKRYFVYGVLP